MAGILPDPTFLRELEENNYFLVIGTIEPRKNHLLLINLWRELIRTHNHPPKLICVGSLGWSNNATLRALSTEGPLSQYITQIDALTREDLCALISGAKALLAPSFSEGFGLPLIEALALNTPIICSDIPVFREITRGPNSRYVSPIDGTAWLKVIMEILEEKRGIKFNQSMLEKQPPKFVSQKEYFQNIEEFLKTI